MKNEEYEQLLNPSPIELIILLCEIVGAFMWRIYRLRPTDFLCRIMGHGFDPEGGKLPVWDYKPGAAAGFTIIENAHIQPEGDDGYAIYDGVVYPNAKVVTKEPWEGIRFTAAEIVTMQQYSPPLRNQILAKKIKYYLSMGKNDEQIAGLVGYAIATVKHYRLAFEKAAKEST